MTATAAVRKKRQPGSRVSDLTEEQRAAYVAAVDFIEGDDREMVIAGAAGTGKTTVIGHVVKALVRCGLKVAITAPTNKAVGVLSQKTREAVGDHCPNVWVGTIHALLGLKPELDERHGRQFLRQSGRPKTEEGMVIVIDECSMIDQNLLLYIRAESTKIGAKVLYVGDWYQLPPVFERESLTFSVPRQAKLIQVIRQARDNPILSLATEIREVLDGGSLPRG
jgi:ATP-dependent exoDNAse (exonuclease V) alpha subunit